MSLIMSLSHTILTSFELLVEDTARCLLNAHCPLFACLQNRDFIWNGNGPAKSTHSPRLPDSYEWPCDPGIIDEN